MFSDTEKKILDVINVDVDGVAYEIRKVTPDDFLDKQGVPISDWDIEANAFYKKQKEKQTTLKDVQKVWVRLFNKAIVSIDGNYDVEPLIKHVIENYMVGNDLYDIIVQHCFSVKKKGPRFGLFRRRRQ
jgi:hypothetical protein